MCCKHDTFNLYTEANFGHVPEAVRVINQTVIVHLSDNFGEKDDHLPLGDGNYDYSEYVDFLKNFDHVITLEVVDVGTDPEPALRARQGLQDLLAAQTMP